MRVKTNRMISLKCRPAPRGPYWTLFRFLGPLTITTIAIDIGEQALYRGLASSRNVVNNLAAFGLAYTFIKLFTGAMFDFKHVSLVLVKSKKDFRKVIYTVVIAGIFFISLSLLIGFTPFGYYLINQLHNVSNNVGQLARLSFVYLSLFPLLDGLALAHYGILLQFKYAGTVGIASCLDIVGQVLSVVILLQTPLQHSHAILIPVIATYIGTLLRLLLVVVSYFRLIHPRLEDAHYTEQGFAYDTEPAVRMEETVRYKQIIVFWFPLAAVQIAQRISRPICNLVVARDRIDGFTREQAEQAVAVLSVCYPIGHLPYGWLNQLKTMEPAFAKRQPPDHRDRIETKHIRILDVFCFLLSMSIMIVLFVIPGVSEGILQAVNNLKEDVLRACIPVLHMFVFFPIPVTNRAACTGILIKDKRTHLLYSTVPVRILAILAVLLILPRVGLHGAIVGISSLLCGFCAESLVAFAMAILSWKKRKRQENVLQERLPDENL